MSFNKRILHDLPVLIDYLKEHGSYKFYSLYIRKTDAFIGPTDSMNFIDAFIEKYNLADVEFFEV